MINISYTAPAKINLFLHITNKLDNGYHLIESVMVFVDYGDELSITESQEFSFSVNGAYGKDIPSDDNNIAIKALDLLIKKAGKEERPLLNITLKKNLPVGAGIGGGSSDAAALMKIVNKECNLGFSIQELQEIGLNIGADIPVCLSCEPSFVSGIGEKILPLSNFPKKEILLVNPNLPLLTKDIFQMSVKQFSSSIEEKLISLHKSKSMSEILNFLKEQKNDLQNSATSLVPEIVEIILLLESQKNCLFSRMSGTGATCFGVFEDKESCQNAMKNIQNLFPNWWVQSGSII